MPGYRLYLMNRHNGHIEGVEEFHSGDDVEAILLVQSRQRDVPAELWCGTRKVIHLDAPPEQPARGNDRRVKAERQDREWLPVSRIAEIASPAAVESAPAASSAAMPSDPAKTRRANA